VLDALFEPTINIAVASFSIATLVTGILLLVGLSLLAYAERNAWLVLAAASGTAALQALFAQGGPPFRTGAEGVFLGLSAAVVAIYGWLEWRPGSDLLRAETETKIAQWLLPTIVGAVCLIGIAVLNLIQGLDPIRLLAGLGQALALASLTLLARREALGWPTLAVAGFTTALAKLFLAGPVAFAFLIIDLGIAAWGFRQWRRLEEAERQRRLAQETEAHSSYSVYTDMDPNLVHTRLVESAEEGFPMPVDSNVDLVSLGRQIAARSAATSALESINLVVEWPAELRPQEHPAEECRIALLPRNGEAPEWDGQDASPLDEWARSATGSAKLDLARNLVAFVDRVHDLDLVVGDMNAKILAIPRNTQEMPLMRFDFSRRIIGSYGPNGQVPRYDLVSDRAGLASWLRLLVTRASDATTINETLPLSAASRNYLGNLVQSLDDGQIPSVAEWRYGLEKESQEQLIPHVV
jgi:hypothetical protein